MKVSAVIAAKKAKTERMRSAARSLFDLQDGVCGLCGEPIFHPDAYRKHGVVDGPETPTIDHVKPRSQQGGDHVSNLLLAHRRCNLAKADRPASMSARIASRVVQSRVSRAQ